MTSFLVETSCIVPAVSVWHPHHGEASSELLRRRARRETMWVAAHSLIEAYSVLTRLPATRRFSATLAREVLLGSFGNPDRLITLDAAEHLDFLRQSEAAGIVGGQTYDALIAACARKAGARAIVTFNAHHFRRFETPTLSIVVPAT